MSEYVYEFVFNVSDLTNGDGITQVTESNSVIQSYSEHSALSGDATFYAELNRVLGNLHLIRKAHPNMGTLVSFVVDSTGNSFKVSLV